MSVNKNEKESELMIEVDSIRCQSSDDSRGLVFDSTEFILPSVVSIMSIAGILSYRVFSFTSDSLDPSKPGPTLVVLL